LELLNGAQKAGYLELRELKPDAKGYLKIVKMAQGKRTRKKAPAVATSPKLEPAIEAAATAPPAN
jgi:hypothetical protein